MSDQIEALKRGIKVPRYARWLGAYRAWRRSRQWRHVCTMISFACMSNTPAVMERMIYRLYERGDGKRKYLFDTSDSTFASGEKRTKVYLRVVEPWLHGRITNADAREFGDATLKSLG